MRYCLKCSAELRNSEIIDGKLRNLQRRKYCLVCSPWGQHNTKKLDGSPTKQRQRMQRAKAVNDWRQRTKARAVEYKGGKCELCGYNCCIWALVFHHKDSSQKSFGIGGKSYSWARIQAELDNCLMLCQNCHAELHSKHRLAPVDRIERT